MSWPALFGLTNAIALAGWAALAMLPRRPVVLSAVLYAAVGLLCLAYLAMFIGLFTGMLDPLRATGAPEPDLRDYSVAGLRNLFRSDGAIVLGWTHYLAFDLFAGLWIARDADRKGVGRLAQLPILFLTFMAGPIGLLVWLVLREWRTRSAARVG